MKGGIRFCLVAALGVMLVLPAGAGDKPTKKLLPPEKYEAVVANLLVGIQSDNEGLQKSCAHMLGVLEAEEAVIPLMRMLRDCDESCARVVAALALCRIGNPRGVYAVKQAVRFDECPKLKLAAAWFYNQYVKEGTFVFREIGHDTQEIEISMK
jgi:hypothetical protein